MILYYYYHTAGDTVPHTVRSIYNNCWIVEYPSHSLLVLRQRGGARWGWMRYIARH